jgi:subtilisin family serine protease
MFLIGCSSKITLKTFAENNDGENITIAILDTGINPVIYEMYRHKIITYDAVLDIEAIVSDTIQHGTSMAVICLNEYNESIQINGISSKSNIIIIKIFNDLGVCKDEYLANGINYAVNKGADVINFSIGGFGSYPLAEEAIKFAYENNILMFAAYEENKSKISFPAISQFVLSVGEGNFVNIFTPQLEMETIKIIDETIIYVHEKCESVSTIVVSSIVAGLLGKMENEKKEVFRKELFIKSYTFEKLLNY